MCAAAWVDRTTVHPMPKTLGVCAALFLLVGCGSGSDDSADSSDPTVQSAALVLQSQIPDVPELVKLDEDNDPNDLIGRPNGYEADGHLRLASVL